MVDVPVVDGADEMPVHPILTCVHQVGAELKGVRDIAPVFMSTRDKRAALVAITVVEAELAELRLRVMAVAGDVAEEDGARDIGSWLGQLPQVDVRTSRADQRLAAAIDEQWHRVAAGMAEGTVSLGQARVVAAALEELPDTVDAATLDKAESQLVTFCADFGPAQLRILGRRILEVVAPEVAEAEDARRLEDEEQTAREKTRLSFSSNGDGTTRYNGVMPDAEFARFRTYLEAFTSPRHSRTRLSGEADGIHYKRKLGQAFISLLEHVDPRRLPKHGGDATTVMVTISLDSLRSDLATAGMLDADLALGDNLSATQARRLACTANIIPVVLGGRGEILDLGRSRRLFSPAQRKAIRLRDKRCRAEGCNYRATWSEVHHLKRWVDGGGTDLEDGILLCSWHHHRIHDPRYEDEVLDDGDLRIRRKK